MVYKGYLTSHGGRLRLNNEDNGYLNGVYRRDDKCFSWECESVEKDSFLCGVFDGVGGEDCGEVASRLAAEELLPFQKKGFDNNGFDQYVYKANRRIVKSPESPRMASTFTILSIHDNQYYFYNMGDSRAYLYRDNKLVQVSKDHNMVKMLLREGILTPEQAAGHPDLHSIYQYLGMKKEQGEEELILEPFFPGLIESKGGDICLLCSDGLTDMVDDEEISQILAQDQLVDEKAKCLLNKALEHGGKDNITILVVEAD